MRSLRSSAPSGSSSRQHLGAVHQRAREGDPLLLPARKLGRFAFFDMWEANQRQHFIDAADAFVLAHTRHLETVANVLANSQVRKQCVILKHCVDGALVRRTVAHLLAIDRQPACGGKLEAADHPQRRRFAAP